MEGILALFIPIIFVIGLFAAISLNIYFKYRTKSTLVEQLPEGSSLADLARVEAEARADRARGATFRTGGFLTGAGIGTAVGCLTMPCLNGIFSGSWIDETAWFVFLILALALFFGGVGLIGSHFVQKALDSRK